MSRDPFDWIDAQAECRRRTGLVPTLRPRPAESPLLDMAGNDYLGLSRHPEVTRAGADACARWGAGTTGSRLVTGSTALHAELEAELATFCGFEAALTDPGTLIVSDSANHALLIDGCRLSRTVTPRLCARLLMTTMGPRRPSPTPSSPSTATLPRSWSSQHHAADLSG